MGSQTRLDNRVAAHRVVVLRVVAHPMVAHQVAPHPVVAHPVAKCCVSYDSSTDSKQIGWRLWAEDSWLRNWLRTPG